MSYQRLDNFQTSLSVNEIEQMRQHILSVLSDMKTKKQLIHSNDYTNAISHLEYLLNMYNGWLVAKKYESQNPYQKCTYNPYQLNQQVVYQSDGTTTTIIDEKSIKQSETWKNQFDQQLLNPPAYTFPPSNVWNIQKIKNINI